jgi:type III pantothenate kinase
MFERFSNSNPQTQLVAVDIGNSRMKLGQFARDALFANAPQYAEHSQSGRPLPEPVATFELSVAHDSGRFDLELLSEWCQTRLSTNVLWSIGSVHRGAAALLATTISEWARQLRVAWSVHHLEHTDVPMAVRVDEPARLGIDRLLAGFAANRLRDPNRSAIVVDLGTAITVDLIEATGVFAGGAILPGIGMAGRALAEQTDALPHVSLDPAGAPPSPLGKSTKGAIEAGLYWGAVGAIGELVARLSVMQPTAPDLFVTGGASEAVMAALREKGPAHHVPHLVLGGIAVVEAERAKGAE